jgi:glutamate-1-semialdehyde 2,1-aminomutase
VNGRAAEGIDSARLEALATRERERYAELHPKSAALAESSRAHWLNGVPMHWMQDWGTAFPLFVQAAEGVTLTDVDGHQYADFCLGDTGAMFGHSPKPVAEAIATQASHGLTCMLPAERVAVVGRQLQSLFGLPYWQITQTATDANRAVLRWCRALTGRSQVLAFQGCYHGTVDETLVRLVGGRTVPRPGLIGPVFDNSVATTLIEFNDLAALERELTTNQFACIIAEPVMTNIGMVLPDPGYLAALAELARRTGTLLVIDETHTLSSGLGGYTRVHGLAPDFLVCGKAIAGGLPCAVFGFTAELEQRIQRFLRGRAGGHSGMGTTLAANPLAVAALHANLTHVMTAENYAKMLAAAEQLEQSLVKVFAARSLPWHVSRVGVRLEFGFTPTAPRNGTESEAAMQPALEHAIHLYLLNRGVLLTPFHNMMLCAPATSSEHITQLTRSLTACLDDLGATPR